MLRKEIANEIYENISDYEGVRYDELTNAMFDEYIIEYSKAEEFLKDNLNAFLSMLEEQREIFIDFPDFNNSVNLATLTIIHVADEIIWDIIGIAQSEHDIDLTDAEIPEHIELFKQILEDRVLG